MHAIMKPHGESEPSLRTTLLYSDMTAKVVYHALVEIGCAIESLPTAYAQWRAYWMDPMLNCGYEKVALEQRLQRSSLLKWWDITMCSIK
jgi:hypothetical protein